jgi:hypothetical protein
MDRHASVTAQAGYPHATAQARVEGEGLLPVLARLARA